MNQYHFQYHLLEVYCKKEKAIMAVSLLIALMTFKKKKNKQPNALLLVKVLSRSLCLFYTKDIFQRRAEKIGEYRPCNTVFEKLCRESCIANFSALVGIASKPCRLAGSRILKLSHFARVKVQPYDKSDIYSDSVFVHMYCIKEKRR